MHPNNSNINAIQPKRPHNHHENEAPKLQFKPPQKWGVQESIIAALIILIIALALLAGSIFFSLFPFNKSSNSSKSTSTKTSTSTTTSKSTSSENTTTTSTSSTSSSISSSKSSTASTSTSSSTSTTSTTSSKTSTSTSTASTSTSTSSSSTTSTSSTTSEVVTGNTKIYFPKGEVLTAVGRNFTGNDLSAEVLFIVLERVKGPTADEISKGFKKDVTFNSESNCDGNWFEISSPTTTTLQIQFCRGIALSGAVADGLLEQGIKKSITENTSYTKVIILDKSGNCLFNASGLNKCKE